VKWLSPVQEKPFPVIYFTSRSTEVNKWILETNVVMKPEDLSVVFDLSGALPCLSEGKANDEVTESLEISRRRVNENLETCRVNHSRACIYLEKLALARYSQRNEYDLTAISDLSKQIKC
jgi:hypothetical protein